MSDPASFARAEIRALRAYEHAQWDPQFDRLHANELPWTLPGDASAGGLNRYPEPQPRGLLARLAMLYEVPVENLVVGRGSDEAIDLLVRAYCVAGQDSVVICPPTFGMYAVAARIQGAAVIEVPLLAATGFIPDPTAVVAACEANSRLVFLCAPNNPTGNDVPRNVILEVARQLEGRALVVVDEAYVEFAERRSLVDELAAHSNLVVLRTLSKAHGLAGARVGSLIAHASVTALARRIIPPYAVSSLAIEACHAALAPENAALTAARITTVIESREALANALSGRPGVRRVWPSATNFLLVEFEAPERVLTATRAARLLVRDVRSQAGCGSALRISIGTAAQNARLLECLP